MSRYEYQGFDEYDIWDNAFSESESRFLLHSNERERCKALLHWAKYAVAPSEIKTVELLVLETIRITLSILCIAASENPDDETLN